MLTHLRTKMHPSLSPPARKKRGELSPNTPTACGRSLKSCGARIEGPIALSSFLARIVIWLRSILGFGGPRLGAMFEDAAKFRREYEVCREQAAKTHVSSSRDQWLLFADEWLKRAQAAEALAKREKAECADAK